MDLCPHRILKHLTSGVTASGNRAFKEIIKVKWAHMSGALTQEDRCPCKNRKRHQNSPCTHREKVIWVYSEKSFSANWEEGSLTRKSNFQPPIQIREKIYFCFLNYHLWHIVMASWADLYRVELGRHGGLSLVAICHERSRVLAVADHLKVCVTKTEQPKTVSPWLWTRGWY